MAKLDKSIGQIDKGRMRRVLGVFDLFAVGYGDLGSSIYYALGITTMYALGAAPIAFLLAGVVFVCTALTYAEMSSVTQEAGGSASFARKAFNDLISFVAGWGLLLDYIVTIAISSYAVFPYLGYFAPILKETWPKIGCTAILIMSMIFLNIRGNKQSTTLSLFLTGLTLLTQIIIVGIGIVLIVHLPEFIRHLRIGGTDHLWSPTWGNFWHGVAMAMVAYTGIESMSQLSSEARDPAKTVPRAIMFAMGTLLIMYFGTALVALSAMSPKELSTTYLEDPIAGIVAALPFGGEVLGPWVGILAAIILIVAANAGLIGASRLSFNMGEHFQLPKRFYHLHPKYKTPTVSLILFGAFAALIVAWSHGSLAFLADLYNFGAMLGFCSAHLSLIMHRIRFPDIERPFKVPLNLKIKGFEIPITAIIGALATAAVFILVVISKPAGRGLGLAWVILGLAIYFINRRRYKISPTAQIELKKIEVTDYKNVHIKKILLPTRGHLATETVVIACDLAKLFGAELSILHVVEVSYMIPINTPLLQGDAYSEVVLKRAQAIAFEKGIQVNLKVIRARSIPQAIADLVQKESFDLVVIGCRTSKKLGPIAEKILQLVKCKVWICSAAEKVESEKSKK